MLALNTTLDVAPTLPGRNGETGRPGAGFSMGRPGVGGRIPWEPPVLPGLLFAIDIRRINRTMIWAWADDVGGTAAGRCDNSPDAAVRAAVKSVRAAVGRHHEVNASVTFRAGVEALALSPFETGLMHLGIRVPQVERAGVADAAERAALAMLTRADVVEVALGRSLRTVPGDLADGEIVIAVDGSLGATPSGGRAGGWGWISTEGFADAGFLAGARRPVLAELAAITKACAAAPTDVPLRVLCDSKTALSMIEQVRNGRSADAVAERVPRCNRSEVAAALERIAGRCEKLGAVTFEWVKGHAGHPLQETADRLAVLGRRRTQAGLTDLSTWIADVSREWREEHVNNLTR